MERGGGGGGGGAHLEADKNSIPASRYKSQCKFTV